MARQKAGPPAYATAPRSASRWLIIALVVALVAATGTAVWAITRPDGSAETVPGDGQSSTAVPIDDSGPADGCLGGLDPTTAMLAARDEAPITASGAAAFTATFLRWLFQVPRPADDLLSTGSEVATEAVTNNTGELTASLAEMESALPAGSVLRGSTLGQRYEVVQMSERDAIVASTIRVVDEAGIQEAFETLLFIRLEVDNGRWRADMAPSDDERAAAGLPTGAGDDLRDYRDYLFEQGVAYEGGC